MKFSVIDPETELYWQGNEAGIFTRQPRFWTRASAVENAFRRYLAYSLTLVNKRPPLRLMGLDGDGDPIIDLDPLRFPEEAANGLFIRHAESKPRLPVWSVEAFTKGPWECASKAGLTALLRVSPPPNTKFSAPVLRAVTGFEGPPYNHYGYHVAGIGNMVELLAIKAEYPTHATVDLEPFWAFAETRLPVLRAAGRSAPN